MASTAHNVETCFRAAFAVFGTLNASRIVMGLGRFVTTISRLVPKLFRQPVAKPKLDCVDAGVVARCALGNRESRRSHRRVRMADFSKERR